MIGRAILHYEILDQLGAGGMGVVYRARDTRLGRTVALKFLPESAVLDPRAKERLILEAKAAAKLDHPNIGVIYSIENLDQQPFIVMALYQGLSLKERLEQGPLPFAEALDITLQTAHGLAKAHENGIIHRDIKPGNLFIARQGLVKILDFGLAKHDELEGLSKPGAVIGTLEYMSPEQVRGQAVDYRTDIWALGVVLYEMLTGVSPFKAEGGMAASILRILKDDPEPITHLRPDVPEIVELILEKALAKDLDDRYSSAQEMITDLETARHGSTAQLSEAASELGVIPPNPYKGLAFFQEEDAARFFGRESFITELERAVRRKPWLVAVVGASGSGKSSVIFAGLVPALYKGGDWLIVSCRPGRQPFLSLALALVPLLEDNPNEVTRLQEGNLLAQALRRGDITLSQIIDRILHKHPDKRVVLIIDQFEELYTFSETDADLEAPTNQAMPFDPRPLLDQLLGSIRHPEERFTLVLAIRADFMGAVLEYRPLVDLMREGQHLLGPMTDTELRRAIVEPAKQLGVTFEDGLIERILRDVTGQEGSLPLLEFALSQLWEKQHRGKLTHQAYDAIGGVEEALANHAEQIFSDLSVNEQAAAQQVFLQLVYPRTGQEDTRRVATYKEVREHWGLVTKLASAPSRLVVTGQDEGGNLTVEVTHEALIRRWGTLRRWINEHRAFRVWQERLRQDVQLWRANHQDEGMLLRGFRLEEAKQMLAAYEDQLGPDEHAFIQASRDLQERERAAERLRQEAQERARRERETLQRRLTQILGSALVVAVVLSGLTLWQWRTASIQRAHALEQRDRAERQANLVLSRQLAAQALAAAQLPGPINGNFDRALLLANQAVQLDNGSTASYGNLVRVLQTIPPQLGAFLWGHSAPVGSVAFSPDSQMLASGDDDTILFWNVATSTLQGVPLQGHADGIRSVAFSSDGKMLASGSRDSTVMLWDVATRAPVGEPLQGHSDEVLSVAFSPDGELLASSSRDGTIIFWQVVSGTMLGTLVQEPRFPVSSIAFSPDGRLLASGSNDNTVTLWEVATRTSLGEPLAGHKDQVRTVAFSPDGEILASGSRDGTIILWDASERSPLGEPLTGHRGDVRSVTFSPDGTLLASGSSDATVILWDVASRTRRGEPLQGHTDEVRSVAFSPDGTLLASGSSDATVILWDVASENPLGEPLTGHGGEVWSVAFSPDGATLASGSQDGTILLWDVANRTSLGISPLRYQDQILSVAFSPDGQILASGSRNNAVAFWDAVSWTPLGEPLRGHGGWVRTVAFSPDGQMLASGGHDATIILWDVASRTPLGEPLQGHADQVRSVAFSPDGTLLASGSSDATVILWDVASRAPLGEPLKGHSDWIDSVSFSPEGGILATSSRDGTIILWDVASGETLGESLRGHSDWVSSIAFSPDGRTLASASRDGTIILWDVASRIPLSELSWRGHREMLSIAFSPDGETLSAGSRDGTVMIWSVGLHSLLEKACTIAGRNLHPTEWQRYLGEVPYQSTCPQFQV